MSAPIIITVPNNYLAMEDLDSKVVVDAAPSRKRRLDHLTWEEKMQRKKLKNRVAAQTSRDRKKARMDEMEHNIKQLMEANEKLTSEVESLKALNERLLSENASLRAAARDVAAGPGPAASPRQQGGPAPALRAAARLLLALTMLSPTSSATSTRPTTSTRCTSSPTPCSRRLMQALQQRLNMSQKGTLESAVKELKWWGPHQSNWNPVKVQA